MPRIRESTLQEHRAKTLDQIIAAAEAILRTGGRSQLTMAEVARRANLARNSLYRYARDADQLCDMVMERHLPDWGQALDLALGQTDDPRRTVEVWTRTNLEQAGLHGHGWLMNLYAEQHDEQLRQALIYGSPSNPQEPDPKSDRSTDRQIQALLDFHRQVNQPLIQAWTALRPTDPAMGVEVTRGIVQSGMRLIDALDQELAPEQREKRLTCIIEKVTACAKAVTATLTEGPTCA
ncbi:MULTISPECIES: TetR/AcrR family transcriptional regulator [Bifidobacterium]|uniref:TetR/AcrR family transcriptional regulator n=1 Tax=Bifidobacterium TaxID=1678 RepID=UPI0020C2B3BB|nr:MULTISPECIES: TetR/AcrR family transcriptional regulator [Bifidobacterium]MCP8613901.1 TetR/AcrR family transcriptional regulator [Bifidobacterium asteroides]MCX8643823.1 TetR/AcrR family transcriptional regulator [Bifidobacterium sp. B4077]MCX8646005.1 TetR/AcrR family transcriptional regulator [Bifidobacterium sp. B4081]MCX8669328.1 TetR/AcrR family transcriptional regulator [Bifidobacterium sp. B3998]MCX8687691.1 TetR/AcrR family transcriptional regulator [Bifidobacterium sp. B4142]